MSRFCVEMDLPIEILIIQTTRSIDEFSKNYIQLKFILKNGSKFLNGSPKNNQNEIKGNFYY